MWILNFLPNIVFHVALLIGILGLIVSFFLDFIPVVKPYKLLVQVTSIFVVVTSIWYEGGIAKDEEYKAIIAEYDKKIAVAEAKSESYNEQLSTVLKDNTQKINTFTSYNKKKLQELADKVNKDCKIDKPIIDILNDAARGIKK